MIADDVNVCALEYKVCVRLCGTAIMWAIGGDVKVIAALVRG